MVSVVVGIVIFIIIVAAGIVSFIHQVRTFVRYARRRNNLHFCLLESKIKNDNEQATAEDILNDLANIGPGWITRLYSRYLNTDRYK